MKRLVALLLICLYLPGSSGATVTVHYCMGRQIGVEMSPYAPDSRKCSNCGMVKENRKGCCNDKQEAIKLNKDQLYSEITSVAYPDFHSLPAYPSLLKDRFSRQSSAHFYLAHGPPYCPVAFSLLYCVFRI